MVPGESVNGQTVQVFFNGSPVTEASWLDEILNHVAPSMFQAVEVYNGSTSVPPVFQPACGVIAIWTRRQ